MNIFYRLQKEPILDRPCVFTFGTFDGVHLGHRHIFESQQEIALRQNMPTGILTFSNHPSEVLAPGSPVSQLTSDAQKLKQLAKYGFSVVVDVPFDAMMSSLTAEKFLKAVQNMVPFSSLVVGSDVSFGKDRKGDKNLLSKFNNEFSLMLVEKFCIDGEPVSSSRIRQLISEGNFDESTALLGRPYCIEVKRTAETEWDPLHYALPPRGMYLAQVRFNGQEYWHETEVLVSSILEFEERTGESHSAEVQLTKLLRAST
jgi:riboflavin kinase/FMN adenylyltransferase